MRKRIIIIIVAFCASFFIMVALSVISMNRFVKYVYYSNFADTSGIIIDKIYQAELHLKDIDRCERGYMLTKDTMYRGYLFRNIDSLKEDIIDIDFLTDYNPVQQKNIDILKDTIVLRIAAIIKNVEYVDTTTHSTLSDLFYTSRELMRSCNRQLKIIHNEENRIRAERQNSEHIYEVLTTHTLGYLFVIFCLVTLVLFFLMIKELGSRIKFQEELQAKIFDLKRSHIELEEIAYAASHDLQEPLRKIQVFSNMLLFQNDRRIDNESKETLNRIYASANRIQLLIADLLSLTSLTKIDQNKSEVDLNRVIQFLLIDLDESIKEKKATINIGKLPMINGYEKQLKLLFNALFDNALKFSREGVRAVITITCKVVDGKELFETNPNLKNKKFYEINFADNGTGFDNQFISKIFKMFQQLGTSRSEFRSKGIGLAICQRIIANHEGYITAVGEIGEGATFKLFFPVE